MSEQLTAEELNFLKETKAESQNIIATLGQIQVERIGLKMRMDELDQLQADTELRFKTTVAKEQEFSQKLYEKYGDAVVDIENGTVTKNS